MEQVTWDVGIDWGSESHAVCVVDAAARHREERHVKHTADAVQACLDWVMTCTGVTPSAIAVAIETPRGALVDACLAQGLRVFAVNPKQLDRFRDRHTVAGAKDDRRDAWVLADSLRTDTAAFQPVHQEDPLVVQLRELSRAEEDLDEDFRRLANQLRSQVHRLVPDLLALCPGADEPWFWALLQLAPTPAAQRRLTRARLDHLLRAHRIRRWRGADVVARLQAPLFPYAPGVVDATEAQIRLILPRLEVVHTQRLACSRQLEQLLQQLRDRPREGNNAASIATSPFSNPCRESVEKSPSRCSLKRPSRSRNAIMTDSEHTWAPPPSRLRAANAAWSRCGAPAIDACVGPRITGDVPVSSATPPAPRTTGTSAPAAIGTVGRSAVSWTAGCAS